MTDKKTRDERVEALFAEIPPPGIYGPRTPTAYERKLAERLAIAEQERDAARRERDNFRRICAVCRKEIEDETDRLCTTSSTPSKPNWRLRMKRPRSRKFYYRRGVSALNIRITEDSESRYVYFEGTDANTMTKPEDIRAAAELLWAAADWIEDAD